MELYILKSSIFCVFIMFAKYTKFFRYTKFCAFCLLLNFYLDYWEINIYLAVGSFYYWTIYAAFFWRVYWSNSSWFGIRKIVLTWPKVNWMVLQKFDIFVIFFIFHLGRCISRGIGDKLNFFLPKQKFKGFLDIFSKNLNKLKKGYFRGYFGVRSLF